MSRAPTPKPGTDIPALKREQLGKGVRDKYFHKHSQASDVVVLESAMLKALPTSERIIQALASLLAVTRETVRLPSRASGRANARR